MTAAIFFSPCCKIVRAMAYKEKEKDYEKWLTGLTPEQRKEYMRQAQEFADKNIAVPTGMIRRWVLKNVSA
jgi:hypothetical protein